MKRLIMWVLMAVPVLVLGQDPASLDRAMSVFSRDIINNNFGILDTRTDALEAINDSNYVELTATQLNVTDYADVDSMEVDDITYTDTYWDDLRVPLTNTALTPTKSEPVFEDMGNGLNAYGFDADADSSEFLHMIAQLPHGWLNTTDVEMHIHWLPSSTNTGNVVWKFIYQCGPIDSTFTAVDSFYITDAADGTALKHQYLDMGDISADSLGTGVSPIILGKLCRVGEDAADTFTGTAYGVEIDFHYQFDQPGSDSETVK